MVTSLLQTNILNLAFVIGVLVYFGKDSVSGILQERRNKIVQTITSAQDRYTQANLRLQQAESSVQQAKQKASDIRSQGESQVEASKQTLKQDLSNKIEELQQSSNASLSIAQQQVYNKIQKRVTHLALQKAEAKLVKHSDQSTHAQLVVHNLQEYQQA